ncbi:hypothetical protein HNS30_33445 [Corallococcus exercitus]|uniref:Uncharacterized protein n=1 Tax=Corallococcus exercitus TaxID=2316736 RepID=A0A7Y4NHT0_9BACT|nr:hypothetical protein [Corallococcus exercitus]
MGLAPQVDQGLRVSTSSAPAFVVLEMESCPAASRWRSTVSLSLLLSPPRLPAGAVTCASSRPSRSPLPVSYWGWRFEDGLMAELKAFVVDQD